MGSIKHNIKRGVYSAIVAIGFGTIAYSANVISTMDDLFYHVLRTLSPVQSVQTVEVPPTPAIVKEKSRSPASTITAAPVPKPESVVKHDWLDVTDKAVDWFVKIIGAITALLGVLGFHKTHTAGVSEKSQA